MNNNLFISTFAILFLATANAFTLPYVLRNKHTNKNKKKIHSF